MILNDLDLGQIHPNQMPLAGQSIGSALIVGTEEIVYPTGSVQRSQTVRFFVAAWQAIGGNAAYSLAAAQLLLKQAEQLASNPDLNPVYVRWDATADPSAAMNTTDAHDGWYVIESFLPDYATFMPSGYVQVTMTVVLVALAGPQPQAMSYQGGALSTTFSGGAAVAVGFPLNAGNVPATAVSRTGAEGATPLSIAPSASLDPLPFTPSATVGDWFKAGCHVYDTMSAGGNAVPTNGTVLGANWVEVKGTDHDFTGDAIVTNGLLLLRIQAGQSNVCRAYLWSTAQASPGWLQACDLVYHDDAAGIGTLRGYRLHRLGLEEISISITNSTINGRWARFGLRLGRGQMFVRSDFIPLSEANSSNTGLELLAANNLKVVANSLHATDVSGGGVVADALGLPADYGYSAAFTNASAQPFMLGLLWQNPPATNMPTLSGATILGTGDNALPLQNQVGVYGFYVIPVGTSAITVDKFQAEGESGALGTGWSSTADATASAGNTAKCASGTLTGNADLFGTAFLPTAGTYNVWFRAKVTSAAGSASEMQLGIWDTTASSFVGSTTFKANQAGTSYVWLLAATSVSLPAAHATQFRAVTTGTLGTDWFIDEAILVPRTLTGGSMGPQDLWQQFLHDRDVTLSFG